MALFILVLSPLSNVNAFQHPVDIDDADGAWFDSHMAEYGSAISGETHPSEFVRKEDVTDDFVCEFEGIDLDYDHCHDLLLISQMMTALNPLTEQGEYMQTTDLGTDFAVEAHAGITGTFMGSDLDETGPAFYVFTHDTPPLLRKIVYERSQELNDRGDGVAKGGDHFTQTLILLGLIDADSSSASLSGSGSASSESLEFGLFGAHKETDLWYAKNDKCTVNYNLLMDYIKYGILLSFSVFTLLTVALVWRCCVRDRDCFKQSNRKLSVDSVSTSPKQYVF